MVLIGVTGLPGSGKTSFARRLAERGATVIDADSEGHRVLGDPAVTQALRDEFGESIVGIDGGIDRTELGRRLVGANAIDVLNQIVHPPLLVRLAGRVREALRCSRAGPVVVDAALIPEWGIEEYFDLVIFVAAPVAARHARLSRAGRDVVVIRELEGCQLNEDLKREASHVVVENASTLRRLETRADALFGALTRVDHREEPCPRRLWSD